MELDVPTLPVGFNLLSGLWLFFSPFPFFLLATLVEWLYLQSGVLSVVP